jgi:hypothetical protein
MSDGLNEMLETPEVPSVSPNHKGHNEHEGKERMRSDRMAVADVKARVESPWFVDSLCPLRTFWLSFSAQALM